MNVLQIFINNPAILLAIVAPVFVFLGIFLGLYISQPTKNRVLQFSPESGRATEFSVKEADEINLRANPVGNTPPQRFVKKHDAYNVVAKGFMKLKHYALWLVRVGTAYTTQLGSKSETIKLTLKETMMNIFGKNLYDQIPTAQKEQIEKGDIGVTVEFPKTSLTPTGTDGKPLPSLSSDDLRRGDIDHFINALARGVSKLTKEGAGDWPRIIFILGSGVGLGVILSLIFGWGSSTIIQPS